MSENTRSTPQIPQADLDPTLAYKMGVAAERMKGPPVEVSSRDLKEIIRLLSTQNRLILELTKEISKLARRI